jgi:hypothetical protein
MELLLLLLAVPLIWLLLLPARLMRRVGNLPVLGPILLAGVLVAAWALFAAAGGDTKLGTYVGGDTQLRAMLD